MDTNLQRKTDIKRFVAFPKTWQDDGKWNEPRPHREYPLQPQVINAKTGKLEPIGGMLNPLTFANAREEAEYLKANPEMAERIMQARARQESPQDRLAASNASMRKMAEAHKTVVAERNALEGENSELRDQLAKAKAELDAALARRNGAAAPVQTDYPTATGGDTAAAPTGKKRGRKSAAEIKAAQAAQQG